MSKNNALAAATHFLELYKDEIVSGVNITPDAIYEWWQQTKDQYLGVTYDKAEALILRGIMELSIVNQSY